MIYIYSSANCFFSIYTIYLKRTMELKKMYTKITLNWYSACLAQLKLSDKEYTAVSKRLNLKLHFSSYHLTNNLIYLYIYLYCWNRNPAIQIFQLVEASKTYLTVKDGMNILSIHIPQWLAVSPFNYFFLVNSPDFSPSV